MNKRFAVLLFTISLALPIRAFAVDYTGEMTELMNAIGDASPTRVFTSTGLMSATSDLGSMAGAAGSQLTLNGGQFSLDGATLYKGLTIGSGQTLNINSFGSLNPDGSVNTSIQSFKRATAGGALVNNGNTTINNTVFSGNYTTTDAKCGGAISNTGNLNIDNSTFTNNRTAGTNGHAGAIYNLGGTVVIDHSTFNQNYTSDNSGGAIYNDGGGDLTVRNSTFYQNATTAGSGGAIGNRAGLLTVEDSIFRGNRTNSSNYGGAISNFEIATIKNSEFYGNSTPGVGGAIALRNGSVTTISGSTFGGTGAGEANYSTIVNGSYGGGAIYGYAASTLIINGDEGTNYFINNWANSNGGAIRNNGTTTISDTEFTGNKATNTGYGGGAIFNENYTLKMSDTIFTNNEANKFAGAVYNGNSAAGITKITNSEFTGNKVNNAATTDGGGAIFNNAGRTTITNTVFNNNSTAGGNGGAILNAGGGTVDIIADNGVTSFTGNTANGVSNAIYLDYSAASKLNLNAGNNGTVTFNDKITSNNIASIIDINNTGVKGFDGVTDAPTNGTVTFNETVSNATVNLYNGTMALGTDSNLDGNNVALYGGTINMMNNAVGVANFNNLALNNTTNLKIDADLAHSSVDRITSTNPITGAGTLNINEVKVISDAAVVNTSINFVDSSIGNKVTLSATEALTPIYKYGLSYNNTTGDLQFARGALPNNNPTNFNPAVLSSPVAAIAGVYTSQTTVYSEALGRMDALMMLPEADRLLMLYRNKTASADGQIVFSPTLLPEEKAAIWVKNSTSFENIPLSNGPSVSSVGYGMLVGGDTELKRLAHGFIGYLTAYTGYNGSHQKYDDVSVDQNGGVLGLTGTVYKGKFFSALTANTGASAGNSHTMYGTDTFTTLMAGIASKTGYNFEFIDGKMIFQPSMLMSYTFANTFEYTNAAGTNITSDPLNAVQLSPGAKLIGNLKNGWQPYLGINMIFNLMDKQKFYANDVQLPQMSVNPYVEYGVGVQRKWAERFTGFGQAMARGGGRNGLALQFGFRWAL
jgi:hypothetical protein